MYIIIVCFPGCDVINFEIDLHRANQHVYPQKNVKVLDSITMLFKYSFQLAKLTFFSQTANVVYFVWLTQGLKN